MLLGQRFISYIHIRKKILAYTLSSYNSLNISPWIKIKFRTKTNDTISQNKNGKIKDPFFDLLLHQRVSCNILIPVITALILQFKLSLKNFDCLNRHFYPTKCWKYNCLLDWVIRKKIGHFTIKCVIKSQSIAHECSFEMCCE